MEELKNNNILKQSKKSATENNSNNNNNNINEFTFKRSTIADNSKLKSSIIANAIEMEEMDQTNNAEQTAILSSERKNQRDPLVHDYPLEITHSIGDDYVRLNNNLAGEDYPGINHS